MKKEYTVKDLIFGSRGIYLENERLMLILKSLCESDNKMIDDFYFKLSKSVDNMQLIKEYTMRGNKESDIIDLNKLKLFLDTANDIINSDFANKLNFGSFFGVGTDNSFDVLTDGIRVRNTGLRYYINFDYNARLDLIFAYCYPKHSIDEATIKYVLESSINAKMLSPYHKMIIENCQSLDKDFEIITKVEDKNRSKIIIDETDDRIILTNTKIKRRTLK